MRLRTAILLIMLAVAPGRAQESEAPGPEAFVTVGVFAEGRLWLLSDRGVLYSVDERAGTSAVETTPEPVGQICRWQGGLAAVTGDGSRGWTLRRRDGGRWSEVARIRRRGDSLVAIDCGDDRVTLLTDLRIVEAGPGSREVRLSAPLRGGRVLAVMLTTPDRLFVGLSAGEWGGGLRRIDRRTGRLDILERTIGGPCGGPLSTACDPVNGIAVSPWRPGCIIVAIGLVHFESGGRLTEVCGDRIERLFVRPMDGSDGGRVGADGEPYNTVAFFGLARIGDELWAAGIDGLYRLRGPDSVERMPMPQFRRVGDFQLSTDIPGMALVVTNVHRRASVSGGAPLLIAR
jgi:hypothetical protein